jgi:hypothetical protein
MIKTRIRSKQKTRKIIQKTIPEKTISKIGFKIKVL